MKKLRFLLFGACALLSAAIVAASCSGGTPYVPPDAGVVPPDAGSSCSTTCSGCCATNGYCFTSANTGNTACGINGSACQVCNAGDSCTNGVCSSNTCNGCYDNTGACQTGNTNTACGTGGGTCAQCTGTQNCNAGTCSAGCSGCLDTTNTCQPGTANGNCGSGGGSCATCAAPQTCVNKACANCAGCIDGTGACQAGNTTSACGSNGATCSTCAGGQNCNAGACSSGCTGCMSGGSCQSGTANTACGSGGGSCTACTATQTCVNQACVPCTGCISNGACQAGTSTSACGTAGAACKSCSGGQSCTGGACTGGGHAIQTVFVIMMENHNWSSVNSGTYISKLIGANPGVNYVAYANNYNTPPGNHPSLPNYLWLEAGTNFGVTADGLPSAYGQTSTSHLVTLLQNAGVTWGSFQECISGTDCPLGTESSCSDGSSYAPKHNPMVFFSDVTNSFSSTSSNCIAHVHTYSSLISGGTLNTANIAKYNFITPDLCDDMHDCSVSTGDTWLSTNVPAITSWSGFSSSALFIIWDEGASGASYDGPIGMIVISPFAKPNYSNNIKYTHSSTLRTMQEIFGVNATYLGDAANATDLSDLFSTFP